MATVETVRGPVQVDDLGPTLMHEHVFALSSEHVQNYGDGLWWDEEVRVADAVSKLRTLRHKGTKTIVDPTVWGLGRHIPRIQRIAEQVDLNIVVAAGLYVYEELPQQYAYRGPGLLLDVPEPMIADFTPRHRRRHRHQRREGGAAQVLRRGGGANSGDRPHRTGGRPYPPWDRCADHGTHLQPHTVGSAGR